jgi:hypothetical protein
MVRRAAVADGISSSMSRSKLAVHSVHALRTSRFCLTVAKMRHNSQQVTKTKDQKPSP